MTAAVPSEEAARGSDDPRVAALFSEFEPRLRQALFAYAGPADVDDAIGETFAHLCGDPERILAMSNPRGYLYRIARDKARGSRRLTPELPPVRHELQPEVAPELVPALARLSPNQRTAVFLGAGLGWSWVEIGEFLGTSESTVRNHYQRGIQKLRHEIGEVDE
ncbi:MAG TPA: sigma-70 family RNA polymerase sigma factor [Acidimicrobiales bacterium]